MLYIISLFLGSTPRINLYAAPQIDLWTSGSGYEKWEAQLDLTGRRMVSSEDVDSTKVISIAVHRQYDIILRVSPNLNLKVFIFDLIASIFYSGDSDLFKTISLKLINWQYESHKRNHYNI